MAKRKVLFSLLLQGVFVLSAFGLSHAQRPTVAAPCIQCHAPESGVVRGSLVSVSEKFKTIQLAVGKLVWVVPYDEKTALKGAKSVADIKKDKEIAVSFAGEESKPLAVSVSVKPPAKLPPDKLLSTEEVSRLISGAEKVPYVLVDSRPAPRFMEGHIPTSVSMPHPAFDKMKEGILPKDKNVLVVFYCGGVT